MMRKLTLLLLVLFLLPIGCSVLPGHWRPGWNQRAKEGSTAATAASWEVGDAEKGDSRFVGLALSGGGSRSANFSVAVMLELQRQGILQQVDVISGVSGGALAGAYYGLHPEMWDLAREKKLREVFGYDIQGNWIKR